MAWSHMTELSNIDRSFVERRARELLRELSAEQRETILWAVIKNYPTLTVADAIAKLKTFGG
jgi:hypothetical protein